MRPPRRDSGRPARIRAVLFGPDLKISSQNGGRGGGQAIPRSPWPAAAEPVAGGRGVRADTPCPGRYAVAGGPPAGRRRDGLAEPPPGRPAPRRPSRAVAGWPWALGCRRGRRRRAGAVGEIARRIGGGLPAERADRSRRPCLLRGDRAAAAATGRDRPGAGSCAATSPRRRRRDEPAAAAPARKRIRGRMRRAAPAADGGVGAEAQVGPMMSAGRGRGERRAAESARRGARRPVRRAHAEGAAACGPARSDRRRGRAPGEGGRPPRGGLRVCPLRGSPPGRSLGNVSVGPLISSQPKPSRSGDSWPADCRPPVSRHQVPNLQALSHSLLKFYKAPCSTSTQRSGPIYASSYLHRVGYFPQQPASPSVICDCA